MNLFTNKESKEILKFITEEQKELAEYRLIFRYVLKNNCARISPSKNRHGLGISSQSSPAILLGYIESLQDKLANAEPIKAYVVAKDVTSQTLDRYDTNKEK